MFLAVTHDGIMPARPGLNGTCPQCHDQVTPKCGETVAWHWAHKPDNECDYESRSWAETTWHQEWKSHARPENREVTLTRDGQTRRADIIVPGTPTIDGHEHDVSCEIQYSPIDDETIISREQFWTHIRWIFYAAERDITVDFDRNYRMSPYTIRMRPWHQLVTALAGHQHPNHMVTKRVLGSTPTGAVYLDFGGREIFAIERINTRGTWASGDMIDRHAVQTWIKGPSRE